MSVLIVEGNEELAAVWKQHLIRGGADVRIVATADEACVAISEQPVSVVVLDLDLKGGSALAVADYASYRRPDARVIFVTATTFFSDGSIFQIIPNAAGYLASNARPEDLAALVDHHRRRHPSESRLVTSHEVQ